MKRIPFFVLMLAMLLALSGCNLGSNQAALATPILASLSLGIQVQNAGAGFSAPGQVIQYQYTVTNTGTSALQGPITVTDDKASVTCPNINTAGNLNASLDPAENLICSGTYTITQADVTAGAVTNTATAHTGTAISLPATAIVRAATSNVLTLTKTASPTSFSQAAQTITFNYTITNTGIAPIGPTQFVVSDDHVTSPISCGAANITLLQNQAVTCSAFYTTTQADVTAGSVTSSASASGGGTTTMGTASNTLLLAGATPGSPGIPVTSNYTPGTSLQYKVVQGEWLIQIARCFGANPAAISKANPQIIDPDEIDPGEVLTIPNIGSNGKVYGPPCIGSHTVQSGDTWSSIAQKYNADVVVLQAANKDASLTAGTVLRIPLNSAGGSPSSGATQAATQITTACNQAQMVADVNMPDGTTVSAGAAFTKTWRLKNVGTCTWTPAFTLIYDHGERMDAPPSTILTTANVAPGATVDVSVPLKAPAIAGTYQTDFKLRAADGSVFGIGANGQATFWVKIVVPGAGGTVIPTATTPGVTLTPTATATTNANVPAVVSLLGKRTVDVAVAQFIAANTDGACPETQTGSRVLECKSPSHSAPYIRLALSATGALGEAPIQEVRIFTLFPGPLPEGLNWNMTRAGVELKLGAPLGAPQDNGNGTVDVEYNTASGTYRLFVTYDQNADPNTTMMKKMRIDVK